MSVSEGGEEAGADEAFESLTAVGGGSGHAFGIGVGFILHLGNQIWENYFKFWN